MIFCLTFTQLIIVALAIGVGVALGLIASLYYLGYRAEQRSARERARKPYVGVS